MYSMCGLKNFVSPRIITVLMTTQSIVNMIEDNEDVMCCHPSFRHGSMSFYRLDLETFTGPLPGGL